LASVDPRVLHVRTSRLRLLGVAVLCAKVALVPLIFDPSLDMPFVVSKAAVSHGFALVLAATMVGLFVQFGSAFFVRSWMHVPVLAFLLVTAASTLLAANPSIALFGTHARMLGAAATVDAVVLYFAIVLFIRTRPEAFGLAVSALAAALPVLGYELVQMLGRDPFDWSNIDPGRPFSTFGESTALAQYLMVLSLGSFAGGLLAPGLRHGVRALAMCYGLLLFAGAVATGTRSAFLGLGAGGLLLVATVWRVYPDRRARAISAIAVVCSAVLVGGVLLLTPVGGRMLTTFDNPSADDDALSKLEPSAATRLALYGIGLEMIRERPILGYGPDNFTVGVPRYRPERAPVEIRQSQPSSAHSWLIQIATSGGLVGLGCFMAIAVTGLALALRRSAPAVAGATMLVAFLATGLTTVNEFATEWLFWGSAGTVAALTSWGETHTDSADLPRLRTKRRRSGTNSPTKRVAAIALLGVAVIAALMGTNALDASRSALTSRQARSVGDSARAIAFGLRATRSDSGRADYWHGLGLAYVSVGRWREAVAAFDRACAIAPYNARWLSDLASANLLLGRTGDPVARDQAREQSDRATRIDPNNPLTHLGRAAVRSELGDQPQALSSIERALALDPQSRNESLYITATTVFLNSGRPGDAVQAAREGLVLLGGTKASLGIRLDLARSLLALGRPKEAVTELDVALLVAPNDPTIEQLRAQIIASLPR
jgi:O-antigen ligase/tetratricopeptide (TPR) repeat protein